MESTGGNLVLNIKLHLYLTPHHHFINLYQNALQFTTIKFQVKP